MILQSLSCRLWFDVPTSDWNSDVVTNSFLATDTCFRRKSYHRCQQYPRSWQSKEQITQNCYWLHLWRWGHEQIKPIWPNLIQVINMICFWGIPQETFFPFQELGASFVIIKVFIGFPLKKRNSQLLITLALRYLLKSSPIAGSFFKGFSSHVSLHKQAITSQMWLLKRLKGALL